MGKGRQRHHYNPRFLLNRFASRADRDKHWIWQIGRDGSVRELSTRNVEVSRRFYGDASAGVEDAFSKAEGHFSELLASIDGGRPPEAFDQELRQLLWTLAARTRAIREQFAAAADGLLSAFTMWSKTADARGEVLRRIYEQIEKAPVPLQQRRLALNYVRVPAVREQLLEPLLSNFGPVVGNVVRMVRDRRIIPTSIKTGQINGLAKLLDRRTPPMGLNLAPGTSFRPIRIAWSSETAVCLPKWRMEASALC
jgi:hypothetical protein